MSSIIVVDIEDWKEYDLSVYFNFISKERVEKIKKYYFKKDAQRSLIAELLIRYILCNYTGHDNWEINITQDLNGKPYFLDDKNCQFNISHSGSKVVCIFDNKPNGIDVEVIQKSDIDLVKRFFHKNEYEHMKKLCMKEKDIYFYFLWTMKEAYTKMLGVGLSKDFSSFFVKVNKDGSIVIKEEDKENYINIYCQSNIIDNQYYVSYCAVSRATYRFMTVKELLQLIKSSKYFCKIEK